MYLNLLIKYYCIGFYLLSFFFLGIHWGLSPKKKLHGNSVFSCIYDLLEERGKDHVELKEGKF
jgi:hypothetical protein